MKLRITFITLLIGLVSKTAFSQLPVIDYLGQTTPGNSPEIFAPGVV